MFDFENPIIKTKIITKMSVKVLTLELFKSVSIVVSLYTEDEILYECKFYTLEGIEYLQWSNDDNYILTYVNSKLEEELGNS